MRKVLQTIVRDTERYSISNSSELSLSKPDLYIEKIVLQGGATATTEDIVVTRSGINLLDKSKFPATQTIKGITWTNNGEGTVTADGTAESGSGFRLDIFYIEGNKTYLMRGCPKEGAANKYFMFDGYGNTGSDLGSGVIKTVSGSDSVKCSPILYIVTGNTVSNIVFIIELFDLTSI